MFIKGFTSFAYSSFVLLSFQFGGSCRPAHTRFLWSTTKQQGAGGIFLAHSLVHPAVYHVEGWHRRMQGMGKYLATKPAESEEMLSNFFPTFSFFFVLQEIKPF